MHPHKSVPVLGYKWRPFWLSRQNHGFYRRWTMLSPLNIRHTTKPPLLGLTQRLLVGLALVSALQTYFNTTACFEPTRDLIDRCVTCLVEMDGSARGRLLPYCLRPVEVLGGWVCMEQPRSSHNVATTED